MITIKRGKLETPIKTVIYGDPGVGKTTFAANSPNPVFLDLEGSTQNLDVARIWIDEKPIADFTAVTNALDTLSTSEPVTLVIDTFDALELMAQRHLCDQFGKHSIEDFGFGKGYAQTAELCRGVLKQLDKLTHRGIGIVIVAHSKITTFNNPQGENYDRYEFKLHKKTGEALLEWADNVLFAHRETTVVENNGKGKAGGSYARYLHAVGSPSYVAKNRYNLPDRFPLDWGNYSDSCRLGAESAETLRAQADALIALLPEARQEKAKAALEPIKNDATKLNAFINYCNATLNK